MKESKASKSDTARTFYDTTALVAGDFFCMNYGYASNDLATEAGGESLCLQLYRHLLHGADLAGKHILEVSCGRGGGAADIASRFRPAVIVGLDFSEQNLRLAQSRFASVAGLSFRAGRAEQLPFSTASFDAVVNVEASHLYDDPMRFLTEVQRVLRPQGHFYYADLCWANSDPASLLHDAGFSIISQEDITSEVLQALDLDSDRRERIVREHIPSDLQQDYRNWSGVKGYRAYSRFASGEWVYRIFRALRSGAPAEAIKVLIDPSASCTKARFSE